MLALYRRDSGAAYMDFDCTGRGRCEYPAAVCATDGPAVRKAVHYTVGLAEELRRPSPSYCGGGGAGDGAGGVGRSEGKAKIFRRTGAAGGAEDGVQHKLRRKLVRAYGSDPAEAIVGYAERNGYHHIIVGSEGRTGAKRMLLGSVAEDVVTRAHCPVTVVR